MSHFALLYEGVSLLLDHFKFSHECIIILLKKVMQPCIMYKVISNRSLIRDGQREKSTLNKHKNFAIIPLQTGGSTAELMLNI